MKTPHHSAFTLIEMLVVVAIISVLAAMIMPVVGRGRAAAQTAVCDGNLRQMHLAYALYLDDHDGRFFPWRESLPEGTLWYWGLEAGGGGEGEREIDTTRARLAPYLAHGTGVETCPALPYRASYFKPKFGLATYGYGINLAMLAGSPDQRRSGISSFHLIARPSDTIAWGDAIQLNTWQSPASPENPMLEEWYYLDATTPPKFHFRHGRRVNLAFADGSVRSLPPDRTDPRCDGLSGLIEPTGQDYYLRLVK